MSDPHKPYLKLAEGFHRDNKSTRPKTHLFLVDKKESTRIRMRNGEGSQEGDSEECFRGAWGNGPVSRKQDSTR